jgi:phosphoglycolate phosphatase
LRRYVLFDLDGTLTDSAPGIVRCLEYAVQSVTGSMPLEADLQAWIGTPLREIFASLLPDPDAPSIDLAIEAYRDRFDRIGIRENAVYPGIDSMLAALSDRGHLLYVATAKRQPDAQRVLAQFGLEDRFEAIFGSRPEHGLVSKTEILALGLTTLDIDASDAAMVGDRDHDITAARTLGTRAIGVAWGYGSLDELGPADGIARSPDQVVDLVGGTRSPAATLRPTLLGSRG